MTRNLHLVLRLSSGLWPLIIRRLPSTESSRSSRRMPANSTLMTSIPSVTNTSVLGIQCVSPADSSRPPEHALRTYSDELTLHMVDWCRRVPHDYWLCKLLLACFDDDFWPLSFTG